MVKKLLAVLLAAVMVLSLAACTKKQEETSTEEETTTTTAAETTTEAETEEDTSADTTEETPGQEAEVMSYADFMAADLDSEVTIESFFQAAQSWWDNKASLYLVDTDGGYFVYEASCTEEQYNQLTPGTPVRVTGYKSEWAGEVEITDATFEIIDIGMTFTAAPQDATADLGTDNLVNWQNQYVKFTGMTVEAYDESGAAFAYKNAEEQTDDLYFKASKDGNVYDFCVEYYLCNEETDVYKAVEALQVGDEIDIEGFLYWYEGPNPHVTAVTPAGSGEPAAPAEGEVMTYAQFAAAELDTEVTIETYFQDAQSWWQDKASIYTQTPDGAYFLYDAACSEELYNQLVPGVKLLVHGYKAEWAGEIEIADATFEIVEDSESFTAIAQDVTDLLGKDEIIEHQNQLVKFTGMTVEAYDEDGAAFAYKDAEGKTDDLYFKASKDGETYEFCVEYYLRNEETDVYKAVEALQVGDVIDIEGYLYWYEGINPHVISVTK